MEKREGKYGTSKSSERFLCQASGLHEKNKRLAFPLCPIKIALISSRGCAGYNDFIEELFSSGYPFQIGFYHASVQGEAVEAGVRGQRRQPETADPKPFGNRPNVSYTLGMGTGAQLKPYSCGG